MISWFVLVPVLVPGLVSLVFFFLGKGIVLHHDLLVPSGSGLSPGRGLSPYFSFLSFSGKGFCSIMISWLLLVPAQVPGLVSLLFSPFFPKQSGAEWGSQFFQETGFVRS